KFPSLNLAQVGKLTFFDPNPKQFPALELAYQVLRGEDSMGAVLNGANEVAVEAFLKRQILFSEIITIIKKTLDCHTPRKVSSVEEAMEINFWAREMASKIVNTL
ncbi:MAG: 1-deoxy-D-xylulose-5-phosphate reductoisomerase, partial [Desulfobacterota bacterium]|nr:1-deoxy-D-xylulose-5-phosphate reductoisomerase [Thermodesulfobacteriota bacterium]